MKMDRSSCYLLQETYRLTEFNTYLTNSFYNDKLISANRHEPSFQIDLKYTSYFDRQKGTSLWLQDRFSEERDLILFVDELKDMLTAIRDDGSLKVAILTPYKDDAIQLQGLLGDFISNSNKSILIETIDRVQGMTVDVTFILLRIGNNPKFVFDKNRFNVATSRAKHFNVIVTDKNYSVFAKIGSKELQIYFSRLAEV